MCSVWYQWAVSTSTPFRFRFNKYKACYRKFRLGSTVVKMAFLRLFSEEGYHGFLEKISFKINDKLTGKDRIR